jgi:hypothetical protein
MVFLRIPGRRLKKKEWIIFGLLIGSIPVLSSCGFHALPEPLIKPEPASPPVSPAPPPVSPAHQPVSPVPPPPAARATRLPDIQFTIQVGAFSASDRAAAFASELNQKGLDAYYFIDEDGLSKVRFERFDSREAAWQRANRLRALGWIDEFFIIHPVALDHRIDRRLSLGQKIVRTAGRYLGTPYRWGGESADGGFDCSGLTMTVYRLNGLDLPRNSRDQFRAGTPIKRSALRQGDLVFFATGRRSPRVTHVGIYTGGGRFIHAPGRGKTIRSASLTNGYFKRRFVGARRYF